MEVVASTKKHNGPLGWTTVKSLSVQIPKENDPPDTPSERVVAAAKLTRDSLESIFSDYHFLRSRDLYRKVDSIIGELVADDKSESYSLKSTLLKITTLCKELEYKYPIAEFRAKENFIYTPIAKEIEVTLASPSGYETVEAYVGKVDLLLSNLENLSRLIESEIGLLQDTTFEDVDLNRSRYLPLAYNIRDVNALIDFTSFVFPGPFGGTKEYVLALPNSSERLFHTADDEQQFGTRSLESIDFIQKKFQASGLGGPTRKGWVLKAHVKDV